MNTEDTNTADADGSPPGAAASVERYEIRVRGRLGDRWGTWFDGLEIDASDDGTTVIRGPIVDQAALHGLLQKLRDLGIPLLSLARTSSDAPVEHQIHPNSTNTTGATP